MTEAARADAMERRILRTATRLGIGASDQDLLRRAFAAGMAPRLEARLDDHHPDFLHPSRTALILMDDARVADPTVLTTALIAETRDPALAPDPRAVQALGSGAAALVRAVTEIQDSTDDLLERLLALPRGAALVTVAERLDHARHLHLRPRDEWAAYHAATLMSYAPLAARTDPVLAGRVEWWCATFQRRFLSPCA